MKKDKYLGYWLIKGTKNFIKVVGYSGLPRWRSVKRINKSFYTYVKTSGNESVDWIRLNCEKVTEETFKEIVNNKI